MSNSEKTVFCVYACSVDGDGFLYFFNGTEKNKNTFKKLVEVYEDFDPGYDEIKIGDEFPLDAFNNVKENIGYFFNTMDFEHYNLYPKFVIISDDKIPSLSDDANDEELEEFVYQMGNLIYDGFTNTGMKGQ